MFTMSKMMYTYIFTLGYIFLLGYNVSYAQEECGINEIRAECVTPCNTCKPTGRICNLACVPGCTCKPNHARNESGVCIPRHLCNVSTSEPKESESTIPISYGCPNIAACKLNCRRRGYRNGICIASERPTCQCNGPIVTPDPTYYPTNGGDTNNKGCPNIQRCVRSCQETGFSSGTCFGPRFLRCRCSRSGTDEDLDPAYPPIHGGEINSGVCPIVRRCIRSCRSQGFPGGTCIGTRRQICRCSKSRYRTAYPGTESLYGRDVRYPSTHGTNCTFERRCESFCIREGFSHGDCVGRNLCKCYKILVPTPAIVEPVEYDGRDEEAESSSGCSNGRRCARSCIRRGHIGGVCVGVGGRRICRCIREEETR